MLTVEAKRPLSKGSLQAKRTIERGNERKFLWKILEFPPIYRFVQKVLAPGTEKVLSREIKSVLGVANSRKRYLDVGCGPQSLLSSFHLAPVGVDRVHAYCRSFQKAGGRAVTASATRLPFQDRSFDMVWNFGMFHHLSDEMVGQAITEMLRVVQPSGCVVVFDGVMPESAWRHPFAWLARKLDRGRYMRRQKALESLLVRDHQRWDIKRFTYSFWGHEGVLCVGRRHN